MRVQRCIISCSPLDSAAIWRIGRQKKAQFQNTIHRPLAKGVALRALKSVGGIICPVLLECNYWKRSEVSLSEVDVRSFSAKGNLSATRTTKMAIKAEVIRIRNQLHACGRRDFMHSFRASLGTAMCTQG